MAINFPSAPIDNDTFTSGGVTWKWSAAKSAWVVTISGTVVAHFHAWADITSGKPTTIAGYGITDFNSLGDARWSLLAHTHAFVDLTAKPTTIGGYGITDFNSLGDARWEALGASKVVPENAQVGTLYTLALADAGKMVTLTNASPITLTVPDNTTVAFLPDTRIDIGQGGAGQVTVVAAVGVTIKSKGGALKLDAQYAGATLWKESTNTWWLIGDIIV